MVVAVFAISGLHVADQLLVVLLQLRELGVDFMKQFWQDFTYGKKL
jgi:hypothetical protein